MTVKQHKEVCKDRQGKAMEAPDVCVCVQSWHLASCTATWQSQLGVDGVACGGCDARGKKGREGSNRCRAARCTLCAAFSVCKDGLSGCVRTGEHLCRLDGVVGQGWRMHAGGWRNACIDWFMHWLGCRPPCWAGLSCCTVLVSWGLCVGVVSGRGLCGFLSTAVWLLGHLLPQTALYSSSSVAALRLG